ncbi:hypothetical protein SARC_11040 [Sphaeroforma arctica JP610]|uniref:Uncharacterized protein n=1 Tax=Sphaeroforma arctica JP610 TaxID=667725 RepID=A0A0L0FJ14_9EUKA|nr:hypothetical protein SARC_11040 [Sphaeroforma arctica JP610]KNC76461.1 hypothetical protein SARC_11040 [Sphaeroforma arctica JP610]|eukprot:XP_014150363.1 hypothetical protein SARC_11040 [Sphaeroforma arctica JP610]
MQHCSKHRNTVECGFRHTNMADALVSEAIIEIETLLRLLSEGEELSAASVGYDTYLQAVVACCDFICLDGAEASDLSQGAEYMDTHMLLRHKLLLNALVRQYGYEATLYSSDTSLSIGPCGYLLAIVCLRLQDYCLDAVGEWPRASARQVASDLLSITFSESAFYTKQSKTTTHTSPIGRSEPSEFVPAQPQPAAPDTCIGKGDERVPREVSRQRRELEKRVYLVQASVAQRCLSVFSAGCVRDNSSPEKNALQFLATAASSADDITSAGHVLRHHPPWRLGAERSELHTCLVWLRRWLSHMYVHSTDPTTCTPIPDVTPACVSPEILRGTIDSSEPADTTASTGSRGCTVGGGACVCADCVAAVHNAMHVVEVLLRNWRRRCESWGQDKQRPCPEDSRDTRISGTHTLSKCTVDAWDINRMELRLALVTVAELMDDVGQAFTTIARTRLAFVESFKTCTHTNTHTSMSTVPTPADATQAAENSAHLKGTGDGSPTPFQPVASLYRELTRMVDPISKHMGWDRGDGHQSAVVNRKRRRLSSTADRPNELTSAATERERESVGNKETCDTVKDTTPCTESVGSKGVCDTVERTTTYASTLPDAVGANDCGGVGVVGAGTAHQDEKRAESKRAKVMVACAGEGVSEVRVGVDVGVGVGVGGEGHCGKTVFGHRERSARAAQMECTEGVNMHPHVDTHHDTHTHTGATTLAASRMRTGTATHAQIAMDQVLDPETGAGFGLGYATIEKWVQRIENEEGEYLMWLDRLMALPGEVRYQVASFFDNCPVGGEGYTGAPFMSPYVPERHHSERETAGAAGIDDKVLSQRDTLPALLWQRVYCSPTSAAGQHSSETLEPSPFQHKASGDNGLGSVPQQPATPPPNPQPQPQPQHQHQPHDQLQGHPEALWHRILSSCEVQVTGASYAWRVRLLLRVVDLFVWACSVPCPALRLGWGAPATGLSTRYASEFRYTGEDGGVSRRHARGEKGVHSTGGTGLEYSERDSKAYAVRDTAGRATGQGVVRQNPHARACDRDVACGAEHAPRVSYHAAGGVKERLRDVLVAGILSLPTGDVAYAIRGWLFNGVWSHVYLRNRWYPAPDTPTGRLPPAVMSTVYTGDAYNLYDTVACKTHSHSHSHIHPSTLPQPHAPTEAVDTPRGYPTAHTVDGNGSESDGACNVCQVIRIDSADGQASFAQALAVCLNQLMAGICLTSAASNARSTADPTPTAHATAAGTPKRGAESPKNRIVSEDVSAATDTLLSLSLFGPGQVLSGLLRMALQNRTQSAVLVDVILDHLRLHSLSMRFGVPLLVKVVQHTVGLDIGL